MDTHSEQQRIINSNSIFEHNFLDSKNFFIYNYQEPPSIVWVDQNDNEKILGYPLSMVDAALVRKGRLIARYEFGKLPAVKAQRLSNHMGFATEIDYPMTIAEIAGQGEQDFENGNRVRVVGFRREAERLEN